MCKETGKKEQVFKEDKGSGISDFVEAAIEILGEVVEAVIEAVT